MILVTGATGHIGNVLIRQLLAKGERIRALILEGEDTTPLRDLDVEQVRGDVLDMVSLGKAVRGVKWVYHLAGLISIMPGVQPLVWRVNVDGTRNILKAARRANVKRLIYTSSIHALQRVDDRVIDESLPYDAHNPYGVYDRSKAAATLHVQQAARSGFDAVIACPTGVIGPYDFRGSDIGSVIRTAVERKPSPYVDGAYDFVDVRDVAQGLILANEKGSSGESYILSGTRISIRYLLETIREITGAGFSTIRVPHLLAAFAAKFTPFFARLTNTQPRFTPYSLEVLRSNANISHAKATRVLGYEPRTIYQSLTDTVSWLVENRALFK